LPWGRTVWKQDEWLTSRVNYKQAEQLQLGRMSASRLNGLRCKLTE